MNNFGTIELCSRLIYSDSCYIESAYYGIIDIIPGLYKCTNNTFVVEDDDSEKHELVGSIELNNIACETDNLKWVKLTSDGMDSGTAGFYDYDYIQNIVASGKVKQWYNKIFEITYPLVDNPNYVDFKDSEYHKSYEEQCNKVATPEEKMLLYFNAEHKYRLSNISREKIRKVSSSTLDDKCFVSCSPFGDGMYDVFVKRDKDNRVCSIKIEFEK